MAGEPPVVDVRGVSKRYGELHVLRDATFTVSKGAMVAITGRSGSGKSTLFKILAGLDRPTKGSVVIDGTDIATLDDGQMSDLRLRRIGVVFQAFNLLPDLTVAENVRLPLDIAGVPRGASARRAQDLLEIVHLRARADSMPNMLSGGEAQRAAVARALANDPAILLADEPTGSLDSENAENVLSVFEDVNASLGTTILVVTHDQLAIDRIPLRMDLVEGTLRVLDARVVIPDRAG